jgi:hypothetical protein
MPLRGKDGGQKFWENMCMPLQNQVNTPNSSISKAGKPSNSSLDLESMLVLLRLFAAVVDDRFLEKNI